MLRILNTDSKAKPTESQPVNGGSGSISGSGNSYTKISSIVNSQPSEQESLLSDSTN
jgi:hypothetical protein